MQQVLMWYLDVAKWPFWGLEIWVQARNLRVDAFKEGMIY